MSKTLHAIYDGEVLRPEGKSDLQPNTRYRLIIEEEDGNMEAPADSSYPLTVLLGVATNMGVTDLSARHDEYAHSRLEDHDDTTAG